MSASHLHLITDIQVRLQCIFIGIYVGLTDIDAGFVQVVLFSCFSIISTIFRTHTFVYQGNR